MKNKKNTRWRKANEVKDTRLVNFLYYNVKRCKQWERHNKTKQNRQMLKKKKKLTRHKYDAILKCIIDQEGGNKVRQKCQKKQENDAKDATKRYKRIRIVQKKENGSNN